jgi:hypothetical protein
MKHVQKNTAVLLKEKWFDVPTVYHYFIEDGSLGKTPLQSKNNWNGLKNVISAPTQYEAVIWLRDVEGVHIMVFPHSIMLGYGGSVEWYVRVTSLLKYGKKTTGVCDKGWMIKFPTHDEALEAGIVHALKNYVK